MTKLILPTCKKLRKLAKKSRKMAKNLKYLIKKVPKSVQGGGQISEFRENAKSDPPPLGLLRLGTPFGSTWGPFGSTWGPFWLNFVKLPTGFGQKKPPFSGFRFFDIFRFFLAKFLRFLSFGGPSFAIFRFFFDKFRKPSDFLGPSPDFLDASPSKMGGSRSGSFTTF